MNIVTVYTTNTCPYCVRLKNFLLDQKISFSEINLEESPELLFDLVEKTGQMGVPQTEVNGNWILGFDTTGIMKHIK